MGRFLWVALQFFELKIIFRKDLKAVINIMKIL